MAASNAVPWIHSGNQLSMVIDGEVFSFSSENTKDFNEILRHLKAGNYTVAVGLVSGGKRLSTIAKHVQVKKGTVVYKGETLHGSLAERIVKMAKSGDNLDYLKKFVVRLSSNPLEFVREELYTFMQKNELPITPTGKFRAYKIVTDVMTDVYTGRFDNSVGKIVKMPREKCDTNRNIVCSTGLHFCGFNYLSNFSGENVVEVEVDPANVTSFPVDHEAKGRCCEYRVVRLLGKRNVIKNKDVLKETAVVTNNITRSEMITELYRKLGKRKVNLDTLKKASTGRITKMYMKHFT